jgi:DNA-binding response OmpR family regulator
MARILVVDDQPDIRGLLRAILELQGHVVSTAANGGAAIDMLRSDDTLPDLVLLDVQMPDIDGWDTLTTIRSLFGDFGPRVIMCTVKGAPRDLLHGWMLGCDGYIWKPFDMKLLVGEIERVLERGLGERARVRRNAIAEAQMLVRVSEPR